MHDIDCSAPPTPGPRTNMHDSGERQQFASGAVRDAAAGKPRPDLISPHADLREGIWLGLGAVKYAERNWEQGIPISRCVASLRRHLLAYMLGCTKEDHMAAIRTNAGFILHYEEEIKAGRLDPAIDDMPKYTQRSAPWAEDEEDNPQWDGLCEVLQATMEPLPRYGQSVVSAEVPTPSRVTGIGMHGPIPGPEAARPAWSNAEPGEVPPTMPKAIELLSTIRKANNEHLIENLLAGSLGGRYGPGDADGLCRECRRRHPKGRDSTVYIAGPMRGYPAFNFPAFHGAAKEWYDLGWDVIDPAAMDEAQGFNPETDDVQYAGDFVKRDIDCIMGLDVENGDGLAVLPGWEKSIGAQAEVALARWRGLPVWEATTGKAIE